MPRMALGVVTAGCGHVHTVYATRPTTTQGSVTEQQASGMGGAPPAGAVAPSGGDPTEELMHPHRRRRPIRWPSSLPTGD